MNQCSVDIGVGASSLDFQDRRVPWTSSGIVILSLLISYSIWR
jgi:hypothetical protein